MFKNFIIYLIILVSFSCKKEPIEPVINQQPNRTTNTEQSIFGKWLLVDGSLYLTNLELNTNTKYNHFDSGKNESGLSWGGYTDSFERIVKNKTTWNFLETMGFVLNDTTLLAYKYKNSIVNIMERPKGNQHIKGSTKALQIEFNGENIIYVKCVEKYDVIDGYNCKYYSILELIKIK